MELKKLAAIAEANYIPFAPHNPSGPIANAATLQIAACCPNFCVLEIMYSDVDYRKFITNENLEYKDGRIDPENSYLTCIEQTDSFDKTRTDGVLTTWRVDKKYPFAILFQKNYIAMTLEVYKTNKSIVPYLALDRLPKDADLKKGRLFGIVSSDYPITYCYLKLFDKDGKQVNKVEYHERYGAFAVALAEYSDKLFCGVCPGEYKLVIEAGLHRGDATLYSGEFTYLGRE
jgi:hypothetical protein